ncbi:MAG: phosphatase PAP2 family protein [Gemmobacter sp.]|uniref:phosphatase PAP2 family protein n=1 Tax=Gemmobacter sp. TaxID=1898957 RepID=UPI00391CCFF1
MTYHRLVLAYLAAFLTMQTLFAAFPGIDLAVSHLFADGQNGFPWANGTAVTVNLFLRRLGEATVSALIAAWVWGLFSGRRHRSEQRLLAYPALCVALACGGLVNLILKSNIGRARPDSVTDFGGSAAFTPAWQVADHCGRNCSFTSGEVAMAASLAIPLLAMLWPHLSNPRARWAAGLAAAAYVGLTALLRIGLGRHFLSDAVFSVLLAAGVALLLYPLLRIEQTRARLAAHLTRPVPGPRDKLGEQRGIY